MGALSKQPTPGDEEIQLSQEMDVVLEKMIVMLQDILQNPNRTDDVSTMETFSKNLIELDAISQKAANLEC